MKYLLVLLLAVSSAYALDKNWGLEAIHLPSNETQRGITTVAVIDSGVDFSHPLLKDNMNGASYDFISNDKARSYEHGTHVAGIIIQVAPLSSLMSLRFYSQYSTASISLESTIKAINYAVDHGVKLINYSAGGEFSEREYLAIKRAGEKDVLMIVAAGNNHEDLDRVGSKYYPCSYGLPNVLCVASIDVNGNLSRASNWGETTVNVAAPGENIYSSLPGSKYGYMSGTSMATAFVTGIASLILARYPSLSGMKVKEILTSCIDRLPQLRGKIAEGGKVNAYKALHLEYSAAIKHSSMISTLPLFPVISSAP